MQKSVVTTFHLQKTEKKNDRIMLLLEKLL